MSVSRQMSRDRDRDDQLQAHVVVDDHDDDDDVRTVHLPDGDVVSYREVGPADGPLVLLIGGLGNHRDLATVFRGAAEARGARLVAFDRPSGGLSSPDARGVPRARRVVEQATAVLGALLDDDDRRPVTVVGHSVGSVFACELARAMLSGADGGPRVGSLALIVPWATLRAPGTNRFLRLVRRLPVPIARAGAAAASSLQRCGLRWSVSDDGDDLVRSSFTPEERALFDDDPAARAALVAALRRAKREDRGGETEDALFALRHETSLADDLSSLASSSIPVDVYYGAEDNMVPSGAVEHQLAEYANRNADATNVRWFRSPRGTHNLLMDRRVLDRVFATAAGIAPDRANDDPFS